MIKGNLWYFLWFWPVFATNITFIRHAESEFNAYRWTVPNVGLSPNGIRQSILLMGKYDLAICSALKRARQTLDYSNIEYKTVLFTELCRELRDGNPSDFYPLETVVTDTASTNSRRIQSFRRYLCNQTMYYPSIAVVSHYSFLLALTGFSFENAYWWTTNETSWLC